MRTVEELLRREDARMEGWVQSLTTLRFKVVGSTATGEHPAGALSSLLQRFSEDTEKLRHKYFEEYSNLLIGEIDDADSLKKVFMNFIREFGTNPTVIAGAGRESKSSNQPKWGLESGMSEAAGLASGKLDQITKRDGNRTQAQPAIGDQTADDWSLGKRRTTLPDQLDGSNNLQGFNKVSALPCIDFECVFSENETKEPTASTEDQSSNNVLKQIRRHSTTTGQVETSISDSNLLSSIKDELDDLFDINCKKILNEPEKLLGFGSKLNLADSAGLDTSTKNGFEQAAKNQNKGLQALQKVQILNFDNLPGSCHLNFDSREQQSSPMCRTDLPVAEPSDRRSADNHEIICLKVHSTQPYQVDVCSRLVRRIRLAQNDPDDLRHRKLLFKTPVIIPIPLGCFRLVYPNENYFLEFKSGSSFLKKFQNCEAASTRGTLSQPNSSHFFVFIQSLFTIMSRESVPDAQKPIVKAKNEEIFVLVNSDLYSAPSQGPAALSLCRKLSGDNTIDFDVVKGKDGSTIVVSLSNSQEKIYIESTTALHQPPVVKDLICTYKLGDTGKFHIKFHRVAFVRHDTIFVVASRRDKKLDDQYLDILVYTLHDSKARHRGTYPSNKVTGLVPLSIDLCCIFPASVAAAPKEKYLSCIDLYNNLMIYFKFNTEKLSVVCHDKAHHRIFKGRPLSSRQDPLCGGRRAGLSARCQF